MFARRLSPPVARWKRSSRNGVSRLPWTPCSAAARAPRRARGRAASGSSCSSTRVRDHDAARRAELGRARMHRRGLRGRVDPPRHRQARVVEVEARERVRPVAEHGHVRASPAARASRGCRGSTSRPRTRRRSRPAPASPRSADSSKVSRRAAMDAAEPAGGEHADARPLGEVRGRGDRRRAVAAARETDAAGRARRTWRRRRVLAERARAPSSSSPTRTSPPSDRDRRGHRAAVAHDGLDLPRDLAGCRAAAARGR